MSWTVSELALFPQRLPNDLDVRSVSDPPPENRLSYAIQVYLMMSCYMRYKIDVRMRGLQLFLALAQI